MKQCDGMASAKDEELVRCYQQDKDDRLLAFLFARYQKMIAGQTRWYNSCSISQEDLFQEGQIGFFKAIRDYNPDHGIPFAIFAQRCVRCQFITALKTMQRLKHQPLNQAYSLDNSIAGEGRDYTLMDILSSEDETINPEYCLIMKEDYGYCRSIVEKELTPFDLRIFLCYICGRSYQAIAANTGVSVKSVDNALHRSKQKLRRHILRCQDIQPEMFHHYLIVQQLLLRWKEDAEAEAISPLQMPNLLQDLIA